MKVEFDRMTTELNQMVIDSRKALIDKMDACIVLLTQQSQRSRRSMREESSFGFEDEHSFAFGQNRRDEKKKMKEHATRAI